MSDDGCNKTNVTKQGYRIFVQAHAEISAHGERDQPPPQNFCVPLIPPVTAHQQVRVFSSLQSYSLCSHNQSLILIITPLYNNT
eukprot:scaffold8545_cov129-Skeletonema_marinoi.AAC.2